MGEVLVKLDRHGHVAVLTLNRPEHRNTITYDVLDALLRIVDEVDGDDDVRAIVVTGQGPFFSAGTDLSARDGYQADRSGFKPLRGGTRDVGGELAIRFFDARKPVIAAFNGTAVGIGVTMSLPMDIRVASSEARFALPFTRRGIVPESCASWFLPRVVGIGRAIDWVSTGRTFTATEALEAGLVAELAPPGQVLERALDIAQDIAANCSPVAIALARQMLWRGLSEPHPMAANRLESAALLALGGSADVREGIAAFREKRSPHFTSRPGEDLPDFYPWWTTPPFAP